VEAAGAAKKREAKTLAAGQRRSRSIVPPALRIRVAGQAPIAATVYELERLRCNLCGEIVEAEAPGVDEEKYDATAGAMIGPLKYGSGVPFYRLEGLEESLGIPLPASTQREILEETAAVLSRS